MMNERYVGVIVRMKRFSGEIVSVYLTLLKVMVPALIAVKMPIEAAVAKATGVSWRATLAIRVGGALVLGTLQNFVYTAIGTHQAERHPEVVTA